jgi:D-glycero-D-manno-heptose 1,7-bisphosphate phosphatase
LIRDVGLLTREEDIHVYKDVPIALKQLKENGYCLIVVSNQAVVARGLLTETEMWSLNQQVNKAIVKAGGPDPDAFYYCPHHPNATLDAYRLDCDCRKPRPGMILQAAREHNIDLNTSFLVGDRITDIIAGYHAGCRTILVQSWQHKSPPIQTTESIDLSIQPDYTCMRFKQAAKWMLVADIK